jgi:hypothetical protein
VRKWEYKKIVLSKSLCAISSSRTDFLMWKIAVGIAMLNQRIDRHMPAFYDTGMREDCVALSPRGQRRANRPARPRPWSSVGV